MNLSNFNPIDVDLAAPAEAFIKSGVMLVAGLGLETVEPVHLPPIIIEVAKTLAYLGASVAFFRFVITLFTGTKDEK